MIKIILKSSKYAAFQPEFPQNNEKNNETTEKQWKIKEILQYFHKFKGK